MKTWVVANQKGGVGKTTTVVSLAALLASRGKRVLVVDTDPHGSLSAYFGVNPDESPRSVYSLFQGADVNLHTLLQDTHVEGVSLLPATTALASLDRQLGAQKGKGMVLARALATLNHELDYVLIDCPPTLGILMVNALAAADYLVIPVQTEFLALNGLDRMKRTLAMIEHSRGGALPHLIVPTLFDKRTRASRQTLEILQARYGAALWELVIPIDTQLRDASRNGDPLPLVAPTARGSLAYSALLDTLLEAQNLPKPPYTAGAPTTEINAHV